MLHTDAADVTELFVGSPHFSLEDSNSREMTREFIRREMVEAAARMSSLPRHFVETNSGWTELTH
jgi:hypothetical protein